jgi:hypothetical protein
VFRTSLFLVSYLQLALVLLEHHQWFTAPSNLIECIIIIIYMVETSLRNHSHDVNVLDDGGFRGLKKGIIVIMLIDILVSFIGAQTGAFV